VTAWRRPLRLVARSLTKVDLVVVVVLVVVGTVRRRGMAPSTGLWFDDSWVAAGAIHGSPGDLLTVGSTNPTFTLLLMGIHRAGGTIGALSLPALVAGVLAAPALYLLARRCGFALAASLLASAVLAVSSIPLMYSGRVKAYAVELLGVLVLAALVVVFARVRWRASTAAAWVTTALVLGGIGAAMLVASAVAAMVLVLHPVVGDSPGRSDRLIRVVAVGLQGVAQLLFLREIRSRFELGGIEEQTIDVLYDGYIDVTADIPRLAGEVLEHVARVGELYPGIPGALAVLAVTAAVAGLVWSAVRGRSRSEVLVGRYLLALLAVALIGGFLGLIPFGLRNDGIHSDGGRFNLWLVPSIAFGSASALHFGLTAVPARVRRIAGGVAIAGAAVVLAWGWFPPGPGAPFGGAGTAAAHIESGLGPDDRVIIVSSATYAYASSSKLPFSIVATPHLAVAFVPAADDPRVLSTGLWALPGADDRVPALLDGAERVFVVALGPLTGSTDEVVRQLRAAGFELVDIRPFAAAVVSEWHAARRGP
jgi:hypothetical protein